MPDCPSVFDFLSVLRNPSNMVLFGLGDSELRVSDEADEEGVAL